MPNAIPECPIVESSLLQTAVEQRGLSRWEARRRLVPCLSEPIQIQNCLVKANESKEENEESSHSTTSCSDGESESGLTMQQETVAFTSAKESISKDVINEDIFELLYSFPFLKPVADQSTTSIRTHILPHLEKFLSVLLPDSSDDTFSHVDRFSRKEINHIKDSIHFLQGSKNLSNQYVFEWYPKFGGVIIVRVIGISECRMTVLGLDQWESDCNHTPYGSERNDMHYVSYPRRAFPIEVGDIVSQDKLPLIKVRLHNLLYKEKEKKQWTYTFLEAMLSYAIQTLDHVDESKFNEIDPSVVMLRGTSTDVGKHTGGNLRTTSWPLVYQATLWQLGKHLFEKAMIHFHHWNAANASYLILKREMLDDTVRFRKLLDESYFMLDVMTLEAIEFKAPIGRDVILNKVSNIHDNLVTAYRNMTEKFLLSDRPEDFLTSTCSGLGLYANKEAQIGPKCDLDTSDDIRKLAIRNIGWSITIHQNTTFSDLVKWIKITTFDPLVITRVEQILIDAVRQLDQTSTETTCNGPMPTKTSLYTEDEIFSLGEAISLYEDRLASYANSQERNTDLMRSSDSIMLRSREMVCKFIAYSLIHQYNVEKFPLLAEYGIGLLASDLEINITDDKAVIDASKILVKYFKAYEKPNRMQVFSTRENNGDGTFHFASKFVKQSPEMLAFLKKERDEEEERAKEHWRKVREKQTKAAELRKEINRQEINVNRANRELGYCYECNRGYHDCVSSSKKREAENTLSRLKTELKQTLQAPSPVINPLPKTDPNAYPVIFFLNMPPSLALLSQATHRAQLMLGPRSESERKIVGHSNTRTNNRLDWHNHFILFSKDRLQFSPQCSFDLHMTDIMKIPKQIGPRSVDDMSASADGVWYPESPSMIKWCSSHDPFLIQRPDSEKLYEARIHLEPLQWALKYPTSAHSEGNSARGNIPYSRMNLISNGAFSKEAFLRFGDIRSFPLLQLRKLRDAIVGRIMPFTEASVHILIRQATFQIGEINMDEKNPILTWKADLKSSVQLKTYTDCLFSAAERLKQSPRSHREFIPMCELAGFVSQWCLEQTGTKLMNDFIDVALTWSNQMRTTLSDHPNPLNAVFEHIRECLMLSYSILAHKAAPIATIENAQLLLSVLIRWRHELVYSDENPEHEGASDVCRLKKKVIAVICLKLEKLLDITKTAANDVITPAVQTVFQRAPNHLTWQQLYQESKPTNCFETVNNQDHYMVNLATGEILMNGTPPGRLPASVKNDPLYRRSFGEMDFAVGAHEGGTLLKSLRPLNGRYYEFELEHQENHTKVTIREVSNDDLEVLELIDLHQLDKASTETHIWLTSLPRRLIELHSHWFSTKHGIVLFRPVHFSQQNPSFLASVGDFKSRTNAVCVAVDFPGCTPLSSLKEVMREKPYFMETPPLMASLLERIESRDFIHTIKHTDGRISVLLPRFNFRFDQVCESKKVFTSCEYADYQLAEDQVLENLPVFLRGYIVLKKFAKNPGKPSVKILMAHGTVICEKDGLVKVQNPKDPGAKLSMLCFDWHEDLREFRAQTRVARLQLAAAFAASSTLLPSPYAKMTGWEIALNLLRKCWSSAPLTYEEEAALHNVAEFSGRSPSLHILCSSVLQHSRRFMSLHVADSSDHPTWEKRGWLSMQSVCDAETAYSSLVKSTSPFNVHRLGLDKGMETNISVQSHNEDILKILESNIHDEMDVDVSLNFEITERIERELCGMVEQMPKNHQEFPINISGYEDALSCEFIGELRASWELFHLEPCFKPNVSILRIKELLNEVKEHCRCVHNALVEILQEQPQKHSKILKMLVLTNRFPRLTETDLLLMLIDERVIGAFNPFLSERKRQKVSDILQLYWKLCVLTNRLRKIRYMAKHNFAAEKQIQELTCVRDWKSERHPWWLVYEVDNMIQIRPDQYHMADHLLKSPGSVSQMNMGLGKTRVIMPMLLLEKVFRPCTNNSLVRLHVPSALLSEAINFFQTNLTASVFHLPLMQQPFHRQSNVTDDDLTLLYEQWQRYQEGGGFQVLAPEHRLSLQLKYVESATTSDKKADRLRDVLEQAERHAFNIFDESDDLLSHRYKLVYSVGDPVPLPSALIRTKAIQSILHVINTPSPAVEKALHELSVRETCVHHIPGEFKSIRLKEDADKVQHIYSIIFDEFIRNPPYYFRWLEDYDVNSIEIIRNIIFDTTKTASWFAYKVNLQRKHLEQTMVLRGMFSFGILTHCLQLRYDVDYGIDMMNKGRTKLAVPFQAAGEPKVRAEFSHPDVALTFTVLAYYHKGLQELQMRDAVRILITLPSIPARRFHYELWIKALTENCPKTIDKVEKLDLSNRPQQQLLFKLLRKNMHVIDFWVNHFIINVETMQYPSRVQQSAWHLPSSSRNVGFSGTKSTHKLLPLLMKQNEPEVSSLRATDGMMLYKILSNSSLNTIQAVTGEARWMTVITESLRAGNSALIDTGSLLAGSGKTNEEIAKYIALHPDYNEKRFSGVIFFDKHWSIYICSSKRCCPRSQSAIEDSKAFILFDDARTRGSDMKMAVDATAGITIGPRLVKDKFIQGAGRLRQLGSNQKLEILIPNEIHQVVCKSDHDDLIALFHWIIQNSINMTRRGLTEWANAGIYFSTTRNADPACMLLKEPMTLEDLYDEKIEEVSAAKLITAAIQKHSPEIVAANKVDEKILKSVKKQSQIYGEQIRVNSTLSFDECEREAEIQQECQEEEEVEHESQDPFEEPLWDYRSILGLETIKDSNFTATQVYSIQDSPLCKEQCFPILPAATEEFAKDIFVTKNFCNTLQCSLKGHQRFADFLVIFRDETLLLVSPREADGIYRELCRKECIHIRLDSLHNISRKTISLSSLILLLLFNGETSYADLPSQWSDILRRLLDSASVREVIRNIVVQRHKSVHLDQSDLERELERVRF